MLEILVTIITAVSNLLLGLFTYLKDPKSVTNRLFAVLTLIIAGWASANYFSLHSPTPETTLFWIRAVMVITSPMGPVIYLLVRTFPRRNIEYNKKLFWALIIFSGLLSLTAITPLMFSDVTIVDGNITPTPGPAILFFALSFVGGPLISFITLFFKLRKATGIEKTQLRYFFFGIAITFTLTAITNFIIVILLKISAFVVFGPLFSLILIGFIAYAIVVHRFLDINLFIARSVAYVLSLATLGSIYAGALYLVSSSITNQPPDLIQLSGTLVFAIVLIAGFQPARRVFERLTNQIFHRNAYNTQTLLESLSRVIASNLVFSDLINAVSDQLVEKMEISKVNVVIFNRPYHGLFKDVKHLLPEKVPTETVVKFCQNLFSSSTDIFVIEEQNDPKVKQIMNMLGATMILPLIVQQKVIGALLVGQKESGEIYTNTDIELMKIIAPQLATGIQNALSYEEIRRFSQTLQVKVDQATSQLRESNQQLQESNEKLQELDKLKDEFVSIASHELRTPLTAIKGYLWLAINKSNGLSEDVKNNLNIAYNSNERLARLVEDMLTMSRIEGNRLKLEKTEFNIHDLLQEIYNELIIRANEKRISFSVQPASEPTMIVADKEKIREVLINIIGNSLKFTPAQGKIEIHYRKNQDSVSISISDTGPGIPAADLPKLFQKFAKLDSSYKQTSEGGTGLGLYISKQIIDLHQGKVDVQSQEGQGTTFTVTLPFRVNDATSSDTSSPSQSAATGSSNDSTPEASTPSQTTTTPVTMSSAQTTTPAQ